MKKIEHFMPERIPEEEQTEVVTVAVAVYNSDAFLDRAIRSVLNQTWKNLEVILVDDGSTDGCPAICDKYAAMDSRVTVIHKENGGLFSARNVGMEHATGTYLTFMDGDDWLDEAMYESMVQAIKRFSADLAVCRYKWVYQDGTVDKSTHNAYVMEGQELLEKYLEEDEAFQIQNAAWNKLYKRSILGELKFPSRWYEDMLYTIQLLNRPARSVYLDTAWYNYVCDRSASIMNRGINDRVFTDLIPNLYDRSAFLRSIGREDLALLQDYYMYKRLLVFYTKAMRSGGPQKKERRAYLTKKLYEGRDAYPKIFSGSYANPNEYRKMKLFLRSRLLYTAAMYLNDTFVIPIKVRRANKRK